MSKNVMIKTVILAAFIQSCGFAVFDTQLFVYPSLSRYLILEIGILIIAFIYLCYILKYKYIWITKYHLFIIAWIGYILVHFIIVQSGEQYRTVYLCTTLLLIFILANIQKARLISRHMTENVLLIVCCIQAFYVLSQKLGIIDSGSIYFETTGCNENPTVTALYLVGCLPMIVTRIKTSNKVYLPLLIVVLIAIMLLRCRTAYLGVIVQILILCIIVVRRRRLSIQVKPVLFAVMCLILFALLTVIGMRMYSMKKDSADSRVLVWSLSAKMVADNPIGYGYGLFEKYYNLRQADYFKHEQSSISERRNADAVNMPYNDYLEHGVEGGIIGVLFLITFYAVMINKSIRQKDNEALMVFLSFAVMSLFNFVYTSIAPWLQLMCYSAFIIDDNEYSCKKQRSARNFAFLILVPFAMLMYKVCVMTSAQLKLKQLDSDIQTGVNVEDKEFAELETHIGTSEAFWKIRAIGNIRLNKYKDAINNIHTARKYSSAPELFRMEYYCQNRQGWANVAIGILDTLYYMQPHKLYTKYQLMQHYVSNNQVDNALFYADDILSTGYKIKTQQAIIITRTAKRLKEEYE